MVLITFKNLFMTKFQVCFRIFTIQQFQPFLVAEPNEFAHSLKSRHKNIALVSKTSRRHSIPSSNQFE